MSSGEARRPKKQRKKKSYDGESARFGQDDDVVISVSKKKFATDEAVRKSTRVKIKSEQVLEAPSSSESNCANDENSSSNGTEHSTDSERTDEASPDSDGDAMSSEEAHGLGAESSEMEGEQCKMTKMPRIKFSIVPPQKEHAPAPPDHMYGIQIPINGGTCAGCSGSRNEEAKEEPILLCDGKGCSREYHLGCVSPPLTEVPPGDFFCIDCDAYGTTAELREYFERCDDARARFGTSREYVESLVTMHMREALAAESQDGVGGEVDERSSVDEDGQLDNEEGGRRKRSHDQMSEQKRKRRKDDERSTIPGDELGFAEVCASEQRKKRCPPMSELSRISELHHDAVAEIKRSGSRKHVDATDLNRSEIEPAFLVGKPVRFYCPVGNSYHIGRIVDWRAATNLLPVDSKDRSSQEHDENEQKPPSDKDNEALTDEVVKSSGKSSFYGLGNVGSSEFLVRFLAGNNGRKKDLRQWIILEEHSLAVGVSLVWGQLQKNRGLKGWKPAQTLIRSTLELIPVRHLLKGYGDEEVTASVQNSKTKDPETWALALFFGEENHALLRLRDEAVDFFSPAFCDQRYSRVQVSSPSKPGHIHPDRALEMAVSLAFIEHEEQQRAFRWHMLPLQNAYHKKALHIIDESALDELPPLVEAQGRNDLENDSDDGPKKGKCASKPKLCRLIEQGLDRFWLWELMGDSVVEKSMDTIESFTVRPVECIPSAMARLKKERGTLL